MIDTYTLRVSKSSLIISFNAIVLFSLLITVLFLKTDLKSEPLFPLPPVAAQEKEETTSQSCPLGSPTNGLWDAVNRWDPQVLDAIDKVEKEEGVTVPGNRIKAHMMIESQGNPDAFQDNPLGDAYGLMQITQNAYVADRIDFSRIMESAYNIYIGTLELAVRYKNAACNKGWDGASYGYFGGDPCGMGLCDPVNGTCPEEYHTMLQNYMKELGGADCGLTDSGIPDKGDPNTGQTACVITKVGNPKASPAIPASCTSGSGAPCQKPPEPYPTDLRAEIIDKWGINIRGDISSDQLQWIYEIFYAVSGTSFLSSVEGTIIQSYSAERNVSVQVGCPGPADGDVDVKFANGLSESGTKAIIIHELTHVFQSCNDNGKTNLSEIPGIIEKEGALTKYSSTGCDLGGIDLNKEDHAETVAYHLNPQLAPQTCAGDIAVNPYNTGKYPLHKALAIQAVGDYVCSQ